jgi:hypothetical protein
MRQSVRRFSAFACIDWSGAAGARPRGIAVAIASRDGPVTLLRPRGGWTRDAVLRWIERAIGRQDDVLIGFDLSPTLPFVDAGAYFPGWRDSPADPRALWAMVEQMAADEPHLAAARLVDDPALAPYFRRHGGREGALFGGGIGRLRAVERRQRDTRQASSASCFNLVGAAQVGKASLSGMRLFHRLAGRIGFWPFDPVPDRGPCLIEIYTSIAARQAGVPGNRSKIRTAADLKAALSHLDAHTNARWPLDDHATDAIVTAAWLRRVAGDPVLWMPPVLTPAIARSEGWTFGVV